MTPQEIDNALEEVSHRLERVRSLYEQYFMGIERTIPSIPKKDLDRRIDALRRTKFNNTAKRFKFQTLVQRYTSLQQYWHRTCREIENGTYRKHLRKAERRFAETTDAAQAEQDESQREAAEQGRKTRQEMEGELVALLDSGVDLDAEMGHVLSQLEQQAEKPSAALVSENAPKRSLLENLGKTDTGSTRRALESMSGTRSQASPRPTLDPLPALQSHRVLAAGPRPAPLPATQTKPPTASPQAKASPAAPSPAAPPPAAPSLAAPSPAAPPLRPAAAAAAPPAPSRAAHAAPTPTKVRQAPAAGPPGAPPARAPGVPPPRRPSPTALATKSASDAKLSEERIRAIHAKYQAARNETKAAAVSYEKLQRSIRETEQALRAKHQGKNVDFDVKIKNGKAILTPRLK